jgi:hypothetical protein
MPNQPRIDNRHREVRVEDELWTAAGEAAAREGTTRSEVMREALRELVDRAAAGTPTHHNQEEENMSETAQVCDHPGIEHGAWSYTWPCPRCGVCRFIGHGPLCGKCYHETAPVPPVAEGKA